MAGVNLTSVKELMGHKTFAMTLRYAHLAPDFQRDAITRLDTSISTRPSESSITAR
jgi:site-specific recombinase XerD